MLPARDVAPYWEAVNNQPEFKAWVAQNVTPHKQGLCLGDGQSKGPRPGPGDASATQMRALAELAEQVGFAELRVSHEQNIVLPHVAQEDLMTVFDRLTREGLATANIDLVSDLIACPGMDYCAGDSKVHSYRASRSLDGTSNWSLSWVHSRSRFRVYQCLWPSSRWRHWHFGIG